MKYRVEINKNGDIFIKTDGYCYYIGKDMTTAILVRDILNTIDKTLSHIYSSRTGFYIQTINMNNSRSLVTWDLERIPMWDDSTSTPDLWDGDNTEVKRHHSFPKPIPILGELSNPEVFAIKGDQAYIGGKLPNGNFCFAQVPFTQPDFKLPKPKDLTPAEISRCLKANSTKPQVFDEIIKSFDKSPLQHVSAPSHKDLARLWAETYITVLKKEGSVICAAADADSIVDKFKEQFTKKTYL